MSRIARIVYPGYPHHVTQRGNNKKAVFSNDRDRRFYLGLLKKFSSQCSCRIHAYCLMPNHVHLLLVPAHESSLAKTMQKVSLCYTQYVNRKYGRSGRLWECRFFSSIVDKEDYLWKVCKYIEQNPLRAGLANNVTEYKWSSAKVNMGLIKSDFIEPVWKYYLNQEQYHGISSGRLEKDDVRTIREHAAKGLPLGVKGFLSNMAARFGERAMPKSRGNPHRSRAKLG